MTNKPRRAGKRALLLLPAALLAAALWFTFEQRALLVTVTEASLSNLPAGFNGLRVVHLSDLHGMEFGEGNRRLTAAVRAQEPDLIVMTGDMIDQVEQLPILSALAQELAAIAPTYYVTGNHEWAAGCAKQVKSILRAYGVTVLDNCYEVLQRNGSTLVLAGVDDPNGYTDQKTPEALRREISAAVPDTFTLLLAHRNDRFEQYAAAGYDLVLSGHGHGGIVRLPFTDGLLGPGRTLFPTRTAGLYTFEGSTLFVSRGLGSNTTPIRGFRLFNRPDLAVLVLCAA